MHSITRNFILLIILILVVSWTVLSQVDFKIKLTFNANTATDSLWLGMSSYNTRCLDNGITIPEPWKENQIIMPPPVVPLYASFLMPPGCPSTSELKPNDFRGHGIGTEIDTFFIRVRINGGVSSALTISWSPDICTYGSHWELWKYIDYDGIYELVVADICFPDIPSYTDPNSVKSKTLEYLLIRVYNSSRKTWLRC